MKRPVTSLCRRPGKKDRLRGSLSPMREQFPPTGTLCRGQAELPGKSRPNEGAKTTTGRGIGGLTPHGRVAGNGVSGAGKAPHWVPAGAESMSGRKNSLRRGAGDCAHGGRAAMGGVWCREGAALGARRGRGHARVQKQPPAKPEAVCRLRPCGNGGHGGSGAGKAPHWVPAGAEGIPGAKTVPGGGRELCADCAHGRAAGMGVLVPGRCRTEHPVEQRVRPGAKTAPSGGQDCAQATAPWGSGGHRVRGGVWEASHWAHAGARGTPGRKTAPGGGRRLSECGIWVLLAPGDPCDLDAQGGQHSQAEDHAQLSQGEVCHQEQAMQSGDQQHSQEQQHAHAEGSQ